MELSSTAFLYGHVDVHNIHSCTIGAMVETLNPDFSVSHTPAGDSVPLKKAPAWMNRTAGAAFGFGGKLVSFANQKTQVTDGTGQVHQRNHATVTLSQEAETWSFLGLLFESDARRELQRKLGFADVISEPKIVKAESSEVDALASSVEQVSIADGMPSLGGNMSQTYSLGGAPEDFFDQQEDDPDFFDKLPNGSPPSDTIPHPQVVDSTEELKERPSATAGETSPDASIVNEEEIQRALIAGNYEVAVDSCFKAGRLADALLIANIFNGELFKKTMNRYMKKCPKPYMQIVRASIDQDFDSLVRTRPVGQWRETLALLATYTGQEGWVSLCDTLAARLSQAGMTHAASLCYICAGTIDPVVAMWTRDLATAQGAADSATLQALQNVIEKAVVFGLATGNKKASNSLAELVTNYASMLAAQGRLTTALEYLEHVPGEASTTVAVLRDRIYRSGSQLPTAVTHAPPFPFILEDVQPVAPPSVAPKPASASTATAASSYAQPATNYGQSAAAANPYSYNQTASAAPAQPAAYTQSSYNTQPSAQPASTYTQPTQPTQPAQSTSMYATQQQPTQPASSNMYSQPQSNMYSQPAAPAYSQPNTYNQPANATAAAAPPAAAPPVYGGYTQPTAAPAPPPAHTPSFQPTTTGFGQGAGSQFSTPHPPTLLPPLPPPYSSTPAHQAPNQPPGQSMMPGMMGGMPGAPAAAPMKPQPPAPPPGPPAHVSVATVDTSAVRADLRPIVDSLSKLYESCAPMATNPAKKREMEDNTKKLGQLFWKLNAGDVAESVLAKLLQLCHAIDTADWHSANHIQVQMTTTDWDACGFWLSVVKRLIKTRQTMG
eukprot:gene17883-24274_t